jgi:hypothetical protein
MNIYSPLFLKSGVAKGLKKVQDEVNKAGESVKGLGDDLKKST